MAVATPLALSTGADSSCFFQGVGGRISLLDEEAAARDRKSWHAWLQSTSSCLHLEGTWRKGSLRSFPRHQWRQAARRGSATSFITEQPFSPDTYHPPVACQAIPSVGSAQTNLEAFPVQEGALASPECACEHQTSSDTGPVTAATQRQSQILTRPPIISKPPAGPPELG
jgi:hypothetical protein